MDKQVSYLELISLGDKGFGDLLLAGAWLTIQLSVCSYIIGGLLGLVGAAGKLSSNRLAVRIADLYTTIVRAVPELLLIIIIFYTGTSTLNQLLVSFGIENIQISGFAAGVAALSFILGAYMTEVYRGAILAVPKGQMEAARAFGMPLSLRFRRILFPLMIRYALPGLGNLWLVVIKDSSLVSVVGLYELLFSGKQAAATTRHYFFFYTMTALGFLLITVASNIGTYFVERRVNRGVRRA